MSLHGYDAATLQALPDAGVSLEGAGDGWSFSPDRGKLVLGYANQSSVGGSTALRFIDTARMRSLGDVPLLPNGTVEATDWLDGTHVLAVVQSSDCTSDTGVVVFGVDARGGESSIVGEGERRSAGETLDDRRENVLEPSG